MTPSTATTSTQPPSSASSPPPPLTLPQATSTATRLLFDSQTTVTTNKQHHHDDVPTLPHSPPTIVATSLVATNYPVKSSTPPATTTLPPPPTVYGELSILGYNGYIPNGEKSSGRRNRSKFLLCQRAKANGIKKSRHYIVKQPQATKAIQDKGLHSISFTFSRSQSIIVEYKQDETTDMFQIGRSSEDPIDFIVLDTLPAGCNLNDSIPACNSTRNHASKRSSSNDHHIHNQHQHHHNENASSSQHHQQHHHHHQQQQQQNQLQHQQQILTGDITGLSRLHRHLAKVGEEMLQFGIPPNFFDHRARLQMQAAETATGTGGPHNPAMPLNFPQPNISNLPRIIAEQLRNQNQSLAHQHQHHYSSHNNNNQHGNGVGVASQSSSSQQQQQFLSAIRSNHLASNNNNNSNNNVHLDIHGSSGPAHNDTTSDTNNNNLICKRSRTTQSTISRFACRIIVDRKPPCTARIYAAGFDSSKNIFLGEKATKWGQNNSIDGLTTNGVLLMHPKRSNESPSDQYGVGGVWREVSVDGGIYAIRESRSAIQKGKRIEDETNILQDGTLIDLCGATLLWRSVDGFKASPTKKSLEEKIDQLNASRPQCPVGLNTLVIPRKPILPSSNHQHQNHRTSGNGEHSNHHNHHQQHSQHNNHRHHHHHERHSHSSNQQHSASYHNHSNGNNHNVNGDTGNGSPKKEGQQPYVYLKCGHVQGYHDWGTIDKSNQRTCPICLSVGTVAKLSMGLEPSFYVDSGPLTHVFNPCGHMASEKTVKYWCSIKIPHGTHFFHAICPFCASPLVTTENTATKLIFQDDLD